MSTSSRPQGSASTSVTMPMGEKPALQLIEGVPHDQRREVRIRPAGTPVRSPYADQSQLSASTRLSAPEFMCEQNGAGIGASQA
jgi:hypothetical protein